MLILVTMEVLRLKTVFELAPVHWILWHTLYHLFNLMLNSHYLELHKTKGKCGTQS